MCTPVIAAQLYTVRSFTQTPADIDRSLARIRKMGYTCVELAALGPIGAVELAKLLRENGLACCGSHTPIEAMQNDAQRVIENHKLWGCSLTAVGCHWPKLHNARTWTAFGAVMSKLSRKLQAGGLRLGYHNHSHEFARFDTRNALDVMLEVCGPKIWYELDTYWVAHAGADPVRWIRKLQNRIPAIHLKDMGVDSSRRQFVAAVGQGNLEFPSIIAAAKWARTEFFVVELDPAAPAPFHSLEISLKYLHEMGLT